RDRARDAFLMGLAASPGDWDVIGKLAELAPDVALREHARLAQANGTQGDDPTFRAQQALLMLAGDRHDDALALIDGLIAGGTVPDMLWQELVRRDPVAAEDRLRARLENGAAGDEASAARLRIVSALRNQGRRADARAELDRLLRETPDHPAAIEALGELDRNAAIAYLRERALATSTGTSWGMYGAQLLAAGRREEAANAFFQA